MHYPQQTQYPQVTPGNHRVQAKDLDDRRTRKSADFRSFGKDIMITDPATAHHNEAADKLARKLATRQPPQQRERPTGVPG